MGDSGPPPHFKLLVGFLSVCYVDIFPSVTDVALQCFQDELKAALVKKRVLLLWLADVEMIYVHLNELPNAEI